MNNGNDATPRKEGEAPTETDESASSPAEGFMDDSAMDDLDPITMMQKELEDLTSKLTESNNNYMRLLAEMENLRKRSEREAANSRKYGISKFAEDVVVIGDNIQMALNNVSEEDYAENTAFRQFVEGVELTEREFLKILERHGVKRVHPEGQRFDPNQHRAMFEIPDETTTAGTVMQVIRPGYLIEDRVIRHAEVGIAKGGPAAPRPTAENNPNAPAENASDEAAAGDPAGENLDKKA